MSKVIVTFTTEDREVLRRVVLITQHDNPAAFADYLANDLTDRFDTEDERDPTAAA